MNFEDTLLQVLFIFQPLLTKAMIQGFMEDS